MNCFVNLCPQRFWILAKKEFRSALFTPALYITTVFFLLFLSVRLYFFQNFFLLDTSGLRLFFSSFPLAYVFVIPAITMKSWAEEKKTGTVEILLSMPFSETELCLGKFISSFMALLGMLFLSTAVPLSLIPLGSFDPFLIAAEYMGVVLLGASAVSLGLLLSSVSKNQAASFLGSSAVLLVLTIPALAGRGAFLPSGFSNFINYVSLSFHFESFARGLLDSRDAAFFVLSTALFLFLNTRALMWKRQA